MKINPIYIFENELSTGVNDVPENGMILVKEDGTGPRVLIKTIQSPIDDIAGFLASTNYIDLQLDTNSELEKLDEGAGDGWRLLGKLPSNYGNIGLNAVDLSHSNGASGVMGATGEEAFASNKSTEASGLGSFASGVGTIASAEASFAAGLETSIDTQGGAVFGKYNITSGGSVFIIGGGSDGATRNNLFEADPTCNELRAPMSTVAILNLANGFSLVTKDYVDSKTLPLLPYTNEIIEHDSTDDTKSDGLAVWNASNGAWEAMDVLDFGTY